MNYWIIFLTGLTTGGLSCLAVQGGLLTSVIANQKDNELGALVKKKKISLNSIDSLDWMPVGLFLVSKLISHTLLGFFLGWIGESLSLSLGVRLFFQVFTAFFMFATAMNLLNVHPIFRYVVIQPPRFVTRFIKNKTKSTALFTPAILGFLTIFIPCGVTQAMEVVAIQSANSLQGALTMFFFVLGTTPLFALIGVATAKLSEGLQAKFLRIASYVLILMAIYSINGVLLVLNSPLTLQSIVRPVTYFFSDERFTGVETIPLVDGAQKVKIKALNNGYSPNLVRVKKDVPVELTVTTDETFSCTTAFTFAEFGISTFLGPTDSQTFAFTPTKKGRFIFSCSMGMYTGVMEVM